MLSCIEEVNRDVAWDLSPMIPRNGIATRLSNVFRPSSDIDPVLILSPSSLLMSPIPLRRSIPRSSGKFAPLLEVSLPRAIGFGRTKSEPAAVQWSYPYWLGIEKVPLYRRFDSSELAFGARKPPKTRRPHRAPGTNSKR